MYIYTCRIIGNNIISVGGLDSQLVQESKNATSESLAHHCDQIATWIYIEVSVWSWRYPPLGFSMK